MVNRVLQDVLSAPHVPAKLVVGVGSGLNVSQERSLASVGRAVCQLLLSRCKAPPADVHDPRRLDTRSASRQANGLKRSRYHWIGGGRQGMKRAIQRETWDTAAFCDYDGVWCDRLLLGDPPARSAVLMPNGGVGSFQGMALRQALLAHPQLLAPGAVCIAAATDRLPRGTMCFEAIGGPSMELLLPSNRGVQSCVSVVDGMTGRGGDSVDVLWIGVQQTAARSGGAGSSTLDVPLLAPMDAADQSIFDRNVLPVGAFACAMWASSPVQAKELIAQRKWLSWSKERSQRVLSSMQSSMVSTRDANLLRAYASGKAVSPRVNERSTTYQAHKTLLALETSRGA